ncbi:MAG: hypothetical protein IJX30_02845 [Clostridia bacterium]|nr:hypothetical protein [Clostridia bacterium]MBQ8429014.1 hypothetical protein [Clostridia bacterium]
MNEYKKPKFLVIYLEHTDVLTGSLDGVLAGSDDDGSGAPGDDWGE